MRLSELYGNLVQQQRGGVLVMVAVWLPILLLFVVFVVEVGNWFEHKRHLQLQADAGALAGGGVFRLPCTDDPIEAATRGYSGDPVSGVYNFQVAPTDSANVHVLINSTSFWNQGGVNHSDGGGPCAAKMVDVKVTESNLPWFFGLKVVPAINAHARVQILQKDSAAGSLPVGVPDNNPTAAAAIFINETTGAVLAVQPLAKGTDATLNGETLTQWSGPSVPVNISTAKTGVIIALSGNPGWTPSGTLSQICDPPLVECYATTRDATGHVTSGSGISFIHGYPTTGTGTPLAPIVRDVILYNVGCTDDSGASYLLHAGCSVGVKAKIDFGTVAGGNPMPAPPAGLGALLKVGGWGCPNGGANPKGCNMVYNTAGSNAGYWTTDGSNGYPVMPADGTSHAIDLNWKTANSSAQTLTSVQRSFSASTATSGPVNYVSVSELGPGANSLSFGTHNLGVTIGVKQNAQRNATSAADPVVYLKVVGSQTQGLDCDPDVSTLRDELGYGCKPQYAVNTGQVCPGANDPLWNDPTTQPWSCVPIKTGGSAGQVNQGMQIRTQDGSSSCVNPNNWSQFPDLPTGDPRIVPVFLVPFGSFNGSGSNVTVPVTGFATFYVTGWSQGNGGNQGDPCPSADPLPGGGYIAGHFIKYIESINTGGGGSVCDFNSFGTCVAVMTQ
jgi:hypothetical protein